LKASGNIAVDSNAFIAYRAGNARVSAAIEGSVVLFMPAMVLGELEYGALNSTRPADNEKAVREFTDQCIIMAVDILCTTEIVPRTRISTVSQLQWKRGHGWVTDEPEGQSGS
jgi:tRNA(fMet)-specific endonuclease VapC